MGQVNHTFAICAYKETKYLEDCIQSLKSQTCPTNIIICTSTPNTFIEGMAEKYCIPLYINQAGSGLSSDWNFAASCVKTQYYTLCHQDDYYLDTYAEAILKEIQRVQDFIIIYTKYYEDKAGVLEKNNINLKIKNFMNIPMRIKRFEGNQWLRRRILSLGNPICCPSVTFNKEKIKEPLFDPEYKNAADWDAWERLSKTKGKFVYCPQYLMAHRVHEESTTSLNIQSNVRGKEDLMMFQRFWPNFIAKPLTKIFGLSEKNNG